MATNNILNDKVFLTEKGLADLKKEFDELRKVKQPSLIKRVARARDFGDLTENTEYTNAREELSYVEGRVAELEELLSKAKVIKEEKGKAGKPNNGPVSLGSRVTVNMAGQKHVFTVVGEWEADPNEKKISDNSPLGKALLGKRVGVKVEVEAPAGKIVYKILKIE